MAKGRPAEKPSSNMARVRRSRNAALSTPSPLGDGCSAATSEAGVLESVMRGSGGAPPGDTDDGLLADQETATLARLAAFVQRARTTRRASASNGLAR